MATNAPSLLAWLERVTSAAIETRAPTGDTRYDQGWKDGATEILAFIRRLGNGGKDP